VAVAPLVSPSQYYPEVSAQGFGGDFARFSNTGSSGAQTSTVASRESSDIALLNAGVAPLAYSLMIGTNDIAANTADATIYSNIQGICSAIKAGVPTANVVVFTLLPANFSTSTGTFETHRQAVNTLIRNGGSCTYTVADVGADSSMGQAGQNTSTRYYFSDGIHPTIAGEAIISSYLNAALISLGF
jgi:lysophospholipase L1-like esterase